jgi:hypothetical protein
VPSFINGRMLHWLPFGPSKCGVEVVTVVRAPSGVRHGYGTQ